MPLVEVLSHNEMIDAQEEALERIRKERENARR